LVLEVEYISDKSITRSTGFQTKAFCFLINLFMFWIRYGSSA